LWKSDGTEAGTMMVADLTPGRGGTFINKMTAVGGTLFFTTDVGHTGLELWKSEGTAGGTALVKDITPGGDGWRVYALKDVDGTLCFTVEDLGRGMGLWKSDGTEAGTVRIKDLFLGLPTGLGGMTDVNGTVFFVADVTAEFGGIGAELWKTDGTEAGTVLVKDINPGTLGSSPQNLEFAGGNLFFTIDEPNQTRA